MRDVMVDLETTGLQPDRTAILQIAAVKFDIETLEVGDVFDRCLFMPPSRCWQESTRSWWMNQKADVLQGIWARSEEPGLVLSDFCDWANPPGTLRFWAKPSHFDFNFISSYCNDYDLANPFHYRNVTDMRSFLDGLHYPVETPEIELPFVGDVHNALFDTLHQLKVLFEYIERNRADMAKIVVEA